MKSIRKMILIALSTVLLVLCAPVAMPKQATAVAATVKNGWSGSYYYKAGKKVKGLQKIGKKKYYFGKNGKLVKEKRAYVLKIKGKKHYYNIDKKGVVTEWTGTAKLAAERLVALKANLDKVTGKNMRASLLKAFTWSASIIYWNNEKSGLSAKKAANYYGKEAFNKQRGDCDTRAYALWWMAKVLGYEPKFMRGYVLRQGGVLGDYAWVEIPMNGKTFVFDPSLNATMRKQGASEAELARWGFKFQYEAKKTYTYFDSDQKKLTK